MPTVDTVVIGAGHAGLATSRLLTEAGIDHVVLDRGRVGERWRTERWDSLHLLTPAWLTRLPHLEDPGGDPDAFWSAAELVAHLEAYAASFAAPIVAGVRVLRVLASSPGCLAPGYLVHTTAGDWHARHVVLATGPHGAPRIPTGLEREWVLPASDYKNPRQLPPGGVVVVGASSSGVQIADELLAAGRAVTLSVGRHTRMPRRYRGMDAFWWLEATGRLARTIDSMPAPRTARREPSMQLIGRPATGGDLDLRVLQERGVRLVGRMTGAAGQALQLDDSLATSVRESDARLTTLLDSLDDFAADHGLTGELLPATRPRPVVVGRTPSWLDLEGEEIGAVVLATGYRPSYEWLAVPVLDSEGHVQQRRGVTPSPGLYVVGQRFQHRRDSGFIGGARHDARDVVDHLLGSLSGRVSARDETAERHSWDARRDDLR